MLNRSSAKYLASFFMLASLLVVACAQTAAPSRQTQTITGRVTAIADGDTLTVLDSSNTQHRVRLQGIDAPESHQDFGTRSRQNLSDLVFNKTVTVEYTSMDRYQRILGKIIVEGRDANLEQLRGGFAWVYRQYLNQIAAADRPLYQQAEEEARAAHRGLWATPNPTPPWDYRRTARTRSSSSSNANAAATSAGDDEDEPASNTNARANANSNTRTSNTNTTRPTNANATATSNTTAASATSAPVIGNRNSHIYHLANCPGYSQVSERNRVPFQSAAEAEAAGYRRARNCP